MNAHAVFYAYWPARTLQAAVRLGIFEQLSRGPQNPAQVAAALGLHAGATERLLQALAAMGWLDQSGSTYRNTLVGSLSLVRGSPYYVGGAADHHSEQLWRLWEHLETAVRDGRSVVPEAFGTGPKPFDLFQQSPEAVLKFLAGMQAGAVGWSEALLKSWNFSQHRHLVDFGGGTGAITGPVSQAYPHLQVTILELEPVARLLPLILPQYGSGGRLRAVSGDFFRPETYPAHFDGAVLGRVLHNWSDQQALQILRNIQGSLPPGGTVLILEHLQDNQDPLGRAFSALSNLTMLVMTGGGRERTASEYEQLLTLAGFQPVATRRTSGPAVIIGQKPRTIPAR